MGANRSSSDAGGETSGRGTTESAETQPESGCNGDTEGESDVFADAAKSLCETVREAVTTVEAACDEPLLEEGPPREQLTTARDTLNQIEPSVRRAKGFSLVGQRADVFEPDDELLCRVQAVEHRHEAIVDIVEGLKRTVAGLDRYEATPNSAEASDRSGDAAADDISESARDSDVGPVESVNRAENSSGGSLEAGNTDGQQGATNDSASSGPSDSDGETVPNRASNTDVPDADKDEPPSPPDSPDAKPAGDTSGPDGGGDGLASEAEVEATTNGASDKTDGHDSTLDGERGDGGADVGSDNGDTSPVGEGGETTPPPPPPDAPVAASTVPVVDRSDGGGAPEEDTSGAGSEDVDGVPNKRRESEREEPDGESTVGGEEHPENGQDEPMTPYELGQLAADPVNRTDN